MPRDSNGLYTLPLPNVAPDTLILAEWANTQLPDIADALTNSLPRNGVAAMTGPLTLVNAPPTQPRHATSKSYVDSFMAYATGMPLGAVFPMASGVVLPSGFLLCDGSTALTASYPDLATALGTTYGPVTATTFTLPDLRDWFVRGKSGTRTVGSQQSDSIGSHAHPITDVQHAHSLTQTAHNHTQDPHTHTATQAAHSHTVTAVFATATAEGNAGGLRVGVNQSLTTSSIAPTVTVDPATATNQAANASITVDPSATGITSTNAVGGTETTPKNIAMNYWIKAVNDSTASPGYLTGLTSSDPQMIEIGFASPAVPELIIKSNVANGTVKLDAQGLIPLAQMPTTAQAYLGPYDASTGNNPSQEYPTRVFASGDTYIISVAGNILLFDPVTFVQSVQLASIGQNIVYVVNGTTPSLTGWYLMVASTTVTASNVSVIPSGTISATNVQDALEELDTEKLPITAINSTVMPYVAPGALGNLLTSNGTAWTSASPGAGTGDVTGPVSATADAVALFNGTSGKIIKNSAVLLPASALVGVSDTQTLTGKSIDLANNTLTGTLAQFDAALTGADFATVASVQTLTNKTINAANNTLTGTAAALSIGGNAATATMAKQVPVSSNATGALLATDAGQCVPITSGMTVPASVMSAGDAVSLVNESAGPLTITPAANVTMYWTNTGAVGSRTLGARSMCTIWCRTGGANPVFYIGGAGVS